MRRKQSRQVEPEFHEVPGLESFVGADHLMEAIGSVRRVQYEDVKVALACIFMQLAAGDDDFKRTISVRDGRANAQATLKKRVLRDGLAAEEVALLGECSIPMRSTGKGLAFNASYAKDQTVLRALSKLMEENPVRELPSDLLVVERPMTIPGEDAIVHALRIDDPMKAVAALRVIADFVVSKSVLAGDETLKAVAANIETWLAGLPAPAEAA